MQKDRTRAISGLQRRAGAERGGASARKVPKRSAASTKQRTASERRISANTSIFATP